MRRPPNPDLVGLPAVKFLLDYLVLMTEMRGRGQASLESFVLRHGRPMVAARNQDMRCLRFHAWPKACFHNAARMAARRGFTYVEGLALGVIPVHHAWCLDAEGLVVDPTWHQHAGGIGSAYVGVPMRESFVRRVASDECGSVIVNWPSRFPLLNPATSAAAILEGVLR